MYDYSSSQQAAVKAQQQRRPYNYSRRASKILLSGKINSLSYPSRKQMYTNYFNNKDIFDWLEHQIGRAHV